MGKAELSDPLHQCVSALSKRSPPETFYDPLHGSHPTHNAVWYMDTPPRTWADPTSLHPPHEDLQHKVRPCKVPTSILRSRSNLIGSSPELSHRQKSVRRVRFRDPEFTVYTYNRGSGHPLLALLTNLALLLSILVMALFYTGWHHSNLPCEGLPAVLAEVVWGYWLWLTMQ